MLSNEDVQEILQLLDTSEYQQLTLETDRFKLSLQRAGEGWTSSQQVLSTPNILPSDTPASKQQETTSSEVVTEADAGKAHLHAIHTPLPGVFYRASKPGAEPFIEVGSRVSPDTQVCIIESMKLMNAVYAEVHGTVVEIPVNNGEAVEKNVVILRIEPDSDNSDAKEAKA